MPPEKDDSYSRDLISRIDERTKALQETLTEFRENVDKRFDDIYESIDKHYTKKGEFDPVKKLVYGFVGFVLLSVGGMFIALLVHSNNLPMETSVVPHARSIIRSIAPTIPDQEK